MMIHIFLFTLISYSLFAVQFDKQSKNETAFQFLDKKLSEQFAENVANWNTDTREAWINAVVDNAASFFEGAWKKQGVFEYSDAVAKVLLYCTPDQLVMWAKLRKDYIRSYEVDRLSSILSALDTREKECLLKIGKNIEDLSSYKHPLIIDKIQKLCREHSDEELEQRREKIRKYQWQGNANFDEKENKFEGLLKRNLDLESHLDLLSLTVPQLGAFIRSAHSSEDVSLFAPFSARQITALKRYFLLKENSSRQEFLKYLATIDSEDVLLMLGWVEFLKYVEKENLETIYEVIKNNNREDIKNRLDILKKYANSPLSSLLNADKIVSLLTAPDGLIILVAQSGFITLNDYWSDSRLALLLKQTPDNLGILIATGIFSTESTFSLLQNICKEPEKEIPRYCQILPALGFKNGQSYLYRGFEQLKKMKEAGLFDDVHEPEALQYIYEGFKDTKEKDFEKRVATIKLHQDYLQTNLAPLPYAIALVMLSSWPSNTLDAFVHLGIMEQFPEPQALETLLSSFKDVSPREFNKLVEFQNHFNKHCLNLNTTERAQLLCLFKAWSLKKVEPFISLMLCSRIDNAPLEYAHLAELFACTNRLTEQAMAAFVDEWTTFIVGKSKLFKKEEDMLSLIKSSATLPQGYLPKMSEGDFFCSSASSQEGCKIIESCKSLTMDQLNELVTQRLILPTMVPQEVVNIIKSTSKMSVADVAQLGVLKILTFHLLLENRRGLVDY